MLEGTEKRNYMNSAFLSVFTGAMQNKQDFKCALKWTKSKEIHPMDGSGPKRAIEMMVVCSGWSVLGKEVAFDA